MLQQANTTETPFAPKEITDFIHNHSLFHVVSTCRKARRKICLNTTGSTFDARMLYKNIDSELSFGYYRCSG